MSINPKKVIPAATAVVLGAIHIFMLARGQKPPIALDQALIASVGALFAPIKNDEPAPATPPAGKKAEDGKA